MRRGKKFMAEQIMGKLREAEVGLAQGKTSPEVVRKLGVTEQRYERWKREYGGVRTDQAKRIVRMASEYGRYRYRRITALLRSDGLGYRPPAPESRRPCPLGSATPQRADRSDPLAGLP